MTPSTVKPAVRRATESEVRDLEEFRDAIRKDLARRRRELAETLAEESILVQPGRWIREEIIERLQRVLARRREQLQAK